MHFFFRLQADKPLSYCFDENYRENETMGYFEGLADASFKTDVRGRHIFYPWGILGKGYVLPDPETYRAQRRFFIKMYMVVLPAIIVSTMLNFMLCILLALGHMVWYFLYVRKITRYWPVSDEKLKASEAYANSARSHNLWMLIALCIFSLLFTLGGIAILARDPVLGILGGGFFGLCTLAIGNMVRLKLRERHDKTLKN